MDRVCGFSVLRADVDFRAERSSIDRWATRLASVHHIGDGSIDGTVGEYTHLSCMIEHGGYGDGRNSLPSRWTGCVVLHGRTIYPRPPSVVEPAVEFVLLDYQSGPIRQSGKSASLITIPQAQQCAAAR